MAEIKAADLVVPPPPTEMVETWEQIEPQVKHDPALRAAVLWSMHGESLDEAARRTGLTRGKINYWLRKLGVSASAWASKQLVGTQRRVAQLALDELQKRLLETPEEMNPFVLNAVAGTATDKVAKFEKWGEKSPEAPSYASALEKLANALSEGKIDLKIEVARRDPPPEQAVTIEILPETP